MKKIRDLLNWRNCAFGFGAVFVFILYAIKEENRIVRYHKNKKSWL